MKEHDKNNIGRQLKQLRKEAQLSIRALAGRLKMPSSTYASYEQRYKKKYLPLELVEKLIPIFSSCGIGRERIIMLAGMEGMSNFLDMNLNVIQAVIRRTEMALEKNKIHLKPNQRARLYMTMFQIARRHQVEGLTHVNPAFMKDFSRAIADAAKKDTGKK